MDIRQILAFAVSEKASDVHLSAGSPPVLRTNGQLKKIGNDSLTAEMMDSLTKELLQGEAYQRFLDQGELDFVYDLDNVCRFRMNLYLQKGIVSIAARLIPSRPPRLEDLHMPEAVRQFAHLQQGLLLVTGPTGCGKSTTLAALIRYMNEHMTRHIITLEDPIEYLHVHGRSLINQREIGRDTKTFASGLRSALRQDPDVILVGEMRDAETIRTAITAAETGHLVLSTLHTITAPQTIDRVINVFPGDEQQHIRTQLASVLAGVICQRLFPVSDGSGRIAGTEILVNVPSIANLIRSDKIHQIKTMMETGRQWGMQTMEQSVKQLVSEKKIAVSTADQLAPGWNKQY